MKCLNCGHEQNKRPLTGTQRDILDFIIVHIYDCRTPPKYRQIANEFGLKSLGTVHEHIKNLEKKGWLATIPRHQQSMEVL